MIPFIRKSIKNGNIEVIDKVIQDFEIDEKFNKKFKGAKKHLIILRDTRTDEQVMIAIIKEEV